MAPTQDALYCELDVDRDVVGELDGSSDKHQVEIAAARVEG
jgi:hypothetical protein